MGVVIGILIFVKHKTPRGSIFGLLHWCPHTVQSDATLVALAVWATQRSDPDFTEATPTLILLVATYLACH
jgi:hypothetical protein